MKIIQENGGYSHEERETYKALIYENVISQMKLVVNDALTVGISNSNTKVSRTILRSRQRCAERLLNTSAWSSKVGQDIKRLWKDKDIRQAFARGGTSYQLNDSAK